MSLIPEDLMWLGLVCISAVILMVAAAAAGLFRRLGPHIRAKMPRPFLGEGSNREWAERKRAELEAGKLSPDTPPHMVPSQAISWWREDPVVEQTQTSPAPAAGDGHQPEDAPTIEPPSDEIERALLESWLNGSGHSDDAWAEKLLGRKNTSLEA